MRGKSWRFKRYRRLRKKLNLDITESESIATELQKLWRLIQPEDLVPVGIEYRATTVITMGFPNLPELVTRFTEHNQAISEERDGLIERNHNQYSKERGTVLFDLYLADSEHYPVDEYQLLTRLRGQLQEHHYLVSQHASLYYQRHSEVYYRDIVTLVDCLLQSQPETRSWYMF